MRKQKLEFRQPILSDKELIEKFLEAEGAIGCDTTFVNTYLWRDHFNIKVAFTEDSYFKCYGEDDVITGYAPPMTFGDYKTAVDRIRADARARGIRPLIGLLTDEKAEIIRGLYNRAAVSVKPSRDSFDYIYERKDLASLSGKKYHAKRNHISRFFRTYDNIIVEEICERNFEDVYSVTERWMAVNGDTDELGIIRDALDHFDALGLFGLLLYVDDKPVAFSIGSRITDEVCDINFEKAVDIDEAYAVINNEFAKHFDSFTYFNREEDMGLEGLRKSKLSYHPYMLLNKSDAHFR